MQLTVDQDPHRFDIAVVTACAPIVCMAVRGDIDLATGPLLLSALLDALEQHAPRVLELDLAGLTFLDARGVSALLRAYHAAAAIGCRVRLVGPSHHIRRVLDLTGVSSVCDLAD
jgi:anti-anti-sigma factor